MGATKIMVIRHAEKPGSYNGVQYAGVNNLGAWPAMTTRNIW